MWRLSRLTPIALLHAPDEDGFRVELLPHSSEEIMALLVGVVVRQKLNKRIPPQARPTIREN